MVAIIPTGESATIKHQILFFWNNVSGTPGHKNCQFVVGMRCFDVLGNRYDSEYMFVNMQSVAGRDTSVGPTYIDRIEFVQASEAIHPAWRVQLSHKAWFAVLRLCGRAGFWPEWVKKSAVNGQDFLVVHPGSKLLITVTLVAIALGLILWLR